MQKLQSIDGIFLHKRLYCDCELNCVVETEINIDYKSILQEFPYKIPQNIIQNSTQYSILETGVLDIISKENIFDLNP